MTALPRNRRRLDRRRLAQLTAIAALVVIGSACGSPDDAPADGSTTTAATTPTTPTSAEPTDGQNVTDEDTNDDTDETGSTEDLAAGDVPAYLAAYQEALTESRLWIGTGDPRPIDRVEFLESLTVLAGDDSIEFVLGESGVDQVLATLDGDVWFADDATALDELSAAVESLEPGDVFESTITVTSADDLQESQFLTIQLDTDLIGGGDSTIQVVDGYATISGVLGTETYLQLRDVIEANPDVDTLVMLSIDGSENDAINLHTSRLIRQAGWTTWLPANGDISSGGVDMFLAGRERVIEPGGFLGVHSWGSSDGDVVAADLPEDHPAHRAQLDYVAEMLGPDTGPDFYFYTLRAAPSASIHRMTSEEVGTYGLATSQADRSIPSSVTGPPAGYLQLTDQVYLKHRVVSCEIDGDVITAALESEELGAVQLDSSDGEGKLSWTELPPGLTDTHPVTGVSVDGGQVSLLADLDLDELIGDDTSGADFSIDCTQ